MDLIPSDTQKIIFAPLNWGLGHASRSCALIQRLLDEGKEIILASDGEALTLLNSQFPQLPSHELPAYNVLYKKASLWHIMSSNAHKVQKAIRAEQKAAVTLVQETGADMIISDSRFGFRDSSIRSVIITHQLAPLANDHLLRFIIRKGNSWLLNQFDECWVPDYEDRRLSGKLSDDQLVSKVRYIGPLSRLQRLEKEVTPSIDILIILSGPEPARSRLEQELLCYAENTNKNICLVRGTDLLPDLSTTENLAVINLADEKKLSLLLAKSNIIMSRSGYSSLMDYHKLGVKACLIPTPGQSEQEYLAEYHDAQGGHRFLKNSEEIKAIFS